MLRHMARSSSGSGRRPLKAEITGSNPVRATIDCSRLLREPFSYCLLRICYLVDRAKAIPFKNVMQACMEVWG